MYSLFLVIQILILFGLGYLLRRTYCIMSQVEELNARLENIADLVTNVAEDVTTLKTMLEEANEVEEPDLTEALTLVADIESRLTVLADATPNPEPATDPVVDDSDGTDGA